MYVGFCSTACDFRRLFCISVYLFSLWLDCQISDNGIKNPIVIRVSSRHLTAAGHCYRVIVKLMDCI